MSFNIIPTQAFERELKRLAKKYPSLKTDLAQLISSLREEPKFGTPIGNDCFKIRFSISSKNKGKSGGARVITYLKITDKSIFLVSIYDKSETDAISNKELMDRIKEL